MTETTARPKTCRACGAQIFLARSTSGRLLRLDLEPVEPGPSRYVLVRSWRPGRSIAVAQSKVREALGDAPATLFKQHPCLLGRQALPEEFE